MPDIIVTRKFISALSKNIRTKYGKEVSHTDAMGLVAAALGWETGPLMHALKTCEASAAPKTNPAHIEAEPSHIIPLQQPHERLRTLMELEFVPFAVRDELLTFGRSKNGERETGLVLVIGETGSGKTLLASSLLKTWAAVHGGIAVAFQEHRLQYGSFEGVIGNGVVAFYPSHGDNGNISGIRSYRERYLLMGDSLCKRSHFLNAIELSKTRLVVATCNEETWSHVIANSALHDFDEETPHSRVEMRNIILSALDYTVATKRDNNRFSTEMRRWEDGFPYVV